jgi:hypothetical protein
LREFDLQIVAETADFAVKVTLRGLHCDIANVTKGIPRTSYVRTLRDGS